MKKIIVFFSCFITTIFVLFLGVNVFAKNYYSIFDDSPQMNLTAFPLTNDLTTYPKTFNVIAGHADYNWLYSNSSINLAKNEFKNFISDGTYQIKGKITDEKGNDYDEIVCKFIFSNSELSNIHAYYTTHDDIYDLFLYDPEDPDSTEGYELDLLWFWYRASTIKCNFKFNGLSFDDYYTDDSGEKIYLSASDLNTIKKFEFSFIYAMHVNEMDQNGTILINLYGDVNNLPTVEYIASKLKAGSQKAEAISIKCISGYSENNYKIGDIETLRFAAYDKYGNTSILNIRLTITDLVGPDITYIGDVLNSNILLSEEELIKKFEISDISGVKSTTYDFSNYLNSNGKPGTYEYSITAVDTYDNAKTYKNTLKVVDTIAPIISLPKVIYSNIDNPLTEEEIRSNIKVYDDVDGVITNYTLTSNYFKREDDEPGKYMVSVTAYDKSYNSSTVEFELHFGYFENLEFDVSDVILVLPKTRTTLTDDIINLLKNGGYIKDSQNISLESDYFSDIEPEGSYDLYIKVDDEIKYKTNILVSNGNIKIGDIKESKINYNIIVMSVMSALILTALITCGVVIYKKRH